MHTSLPQNEAGRLEALGRYDILDTPPEEAFDRITRLASSVLKVPIVLVSLVDDTRQWFKSRMGLETVETPREISFCTHAIRGQDVFLVTDALKDERFRDNPLVTGGPKIRFYAGAPLKTEDGYNIGTLCIIDRVPRQITEADKKLLDDLATVVMDEMQLRLAGRKALDEIEERKRTQSELRWAKRNEEISRKHAEAARSEAERANRSKSEFLANMSHEIRTPMNGIIGMADLLSNTSLDEEQLEFVSTIRTSGDHLLKVINDILDFSKIEAGKLEFEETDFDLRTCVEEVGDLLAPRIADSNLELIIDIPPDLATSVRGDASRVRQMLINLVSNAIKFTDTGEIVVGVSLVDEIKIGTLYRFEVRDTGIGVPPDRIHQLFEPFVQAGVSTARHHGGTGLGLTITKRLAEAMGGRVGCASDPGHGSTFWFTVKLLIRDSETDSRSTGHDSLARARALIVQDNDTNRKILRRQLLSWGMIVDEAFGGETFLDELHRRDAEGLGPDLILCDAQMPGMDGLDLVRRVKKDPAGCRIPVIILSSVGTWDRARELEEAGLAAYLLKPVRQTLLLESIAGVLARAPVAERGVDRRVLSERPPAVGSGGELGRVLVAEDSLVNQKVVVSMLGKLGYAAHVVADGHEVLKALEEDSYDVLLLDCQMPLMNGYETAERIRIREEEIGVAHLPIIALTAHAMSGDRERCLASGMDDYLSKPLRQEQLRSMLEKHLPVRSTGGPETESSP